MFSTLWSSRKGCRSGCWVKHPGIAYSNCAGSMQLSGHVQGLVTLKPGATWDQVSWKTVCPWIEFRTLMVNFYSWHHTLYNATGWWLKKGVFQHCPCIIECPPPCQTWSISQQLFLSTWWVIFLPKFFLSYNIGPCFYWIPIFTWFYDNSF